MIWQSEAVLYGMMIANVAAVLAALLWAWRRGHLSNLDNAADLLFEEPPSAEPGGMRAKSAKADHIGGRGRDSRLRERQK